MKALFGCLFLLFLLSAAAGCSCGDDDDNDSGDDSGDDDDDSDDDDSDDDTGSGEDRIADYLRGEPYPKLLFEVDVAPGYGPREQSMTDTESYLSTVIDKPGGISDAIDETVALSDDGTWTFDEVKALAADTFNMETDSETVKIHVLYLDGVYDDPSAGGTVLGVAWSNTHLAMFPDSIDDSCQGVLPGFSETLCEKAESHILTHEIGHILGLVDNGLPMQTPHKDATHGAHDVNDQCLMYWSYEGPSIVNELADRLTDGGGDLTYDDACLADIAAVRDE